MKPRGMTSTQMPLGNIVTYFPVFLSSQFCTELCYFIPEFGSFHSRPFSQIELAFLKRSNFLFLCSNKRVGIDFIVR